MKSARTSTDFIGVIDGDFAWRLKELADLKMSVKGMDISRVKSFVRAGLPLAYAHWEGFVKSSAQYYLGFVLLQKRNLEELKPCFIALSARKILNSFAETRRTELQFQLVQFLTSDKTMKAKASYNIDINTKSNLSSSVFEDIALSINLDLTFYETKFKFIDESLLKRRNQIAHGNYLDLDAVSFRNLVEEVIILIRQFKTDISNMALNQSYLK
jgi:hypothetical protein